VTLPPRLLTTAAFFAFQGDDGIRKVVTGYHQFHAARNALATTGGRPAMMATGATELSGRGNAK
jgi:hypothetical protein